MSLNEFAKSLNQEDKVEGELIRTIFVSLLTSIIVFALLYFLKLKYMDNFIPKYGFFILIGILSYSIILPSIRQIRAYKEFPCMSGMMVGMTIGMISGFMPGFIVGATNGMFYGSVFGMVIGITLGIWNGKCCGIMGVMEGIMAGFMGGLMGAMSSVMMLNDNLSAATIIVFVITSIIMISLNYMIYKETRSFDRKLKEDESFTIFISFILSTLTIWFVTYGPRSALFQ